MPRSKKATAPVAEQPLDPQTSQPAAPQLNRWLAVEAAAAYLDISANYLRRLIHDGQIKAIRFGHNFRLDRLDLDQLMIRRKRVVPPYRKNTHPWVAKRHAVGRKRAAQ
jgi:excisionase family DNA binding protein